MLKHINRTANLRKSKKLLISYVKPHKEVSKDTVSRWIKDVLKSSGIDINTFTSHSCRSAASSKARIVGIHMSKILSNAGWANEKTFAKYYSRDIENEFNIIS